MKQSNFLGRLLRGWRAWWLASALTAATVAGWAVATVLTRLQWAPTPALTAAWTVILVTLGVLWAMSPPLTASAVARHLNRLLDAMEDSAELLVDTPEDLGPLQRIQRARVAQRLETTDAVRLRVPGRIVRAPLVTAMAAGLIGAVVYLWPAAAPGDHRPTTAPGSDLPGPSMTDFAITVTPPDYTELPPRTVTDWDIEVVEGSQVQWRVAIANAAATETWLQSVDGDSVAFRSGAAPGGESAVLTMPAGHSMVYRILVRHSGNEYASPFARFVVHPDLPPSLAITAPQDRTVFAPDARWLVPLEATARDDFGLTDPVIVATVASGHGESVRFREIRQPFGQVVRRSARTFDLRDTLDLAALGMVPGDELYLYVQARDNRRPVPNEARTEAVIIAIEDTTTVLVSDVQGLAVDRMPDYFRSQRQIIIDTERLLAERPAITEQAFRDRSRHIGFDQQLLRLRYSELVGDEFEDTPLGLTEEDAGALGFESLVPDEPLPDDPTIREEGVEESAEDPTEEVRHEHDDPENATRLAQTVKTMLKASLDQMWQAEVRLRTDRPAEALPYERRALDLLKRVQQAARSYVLRTGFEPAPLDVSALRLTGELDQIRGGTIATASDHDPSEPDVRAALMVVRAERTGFRTGFRESRLELLDGGGRVLARKALADPVQFLEALGAMRQLADSLEDGVTCASCLDAIEAGLLNALPESVPWRTAARPAAAGSALRYSEELTRAP